MSYLLWCHYKKAKTEGHPDDKVNTTEQNTWKSTRRQGQHIQMRTFHWCLLQEEKKEENQGNKHTKKRRRNSYSFTRHWHPNWGKPLNLSLHVVTATFLQNMEGARAKQSWTDTNWGPLYGRKKYFRNLSCCLVAKPVHNAGKYGMAAIILGDFERRMVFPESDVGAPAVWPM